MLSDGKRSIVVRLTRVAGDGADETVIVKTAKVSAEREEQNKRYINVEVEWLEKLAGCPHPYRGYYSLGAMSFSAWKDCGITLDKLDISGHAGQKLARLVRRDHFRWRADVFRAKRCVPW